MSERDAARDELRKLIHDHFCGCDDKGCGDFGGASYDAAVDILERGYRRSVTPDQIEAVAELVYDVDHGYQFSERGLEFVRKIARAFGLEVTE